MAMRLASAGAQTVLEVVAALSATVGRPRHSERESATHRCFFERDEFLEQNSTGREGCGRLATICPLVERQEVEQAAAITARFVSLLLLALSTNATGRFPAIHRRNTGSLTLIQRVSVPQRCPAFCCA